MTYTVKEIFYTLQGEGANVGRPAVFLRFAGCNLWNGYEEHRVNAICQFCDTQFVGGTKYKTATELADEVSRHWPGQYQKFVVVTGGEPALQLDKQLIDSLHRRHFTIAVETNGTVAIDGKPDWVTVSPKTRDLITTSGDELKLVYPQGAIMPEHFAAMSFSLFWLQPMDIGEQRAANTRAAIRYCMEHPQWRLSQQTHKLAGIP